MHRERARHTYIEERGREETRERDGIAVLVANAHRRQKSENSPAALYPLLFSRQWNACICAFYVPVRRSSEPLGLFPSPLAFVQLVSLRISSFLLDTLLVGQRCVCAPPPQGNTEEQEILIKVARIKTKERERRAPDMSKSTRSGARHVLAQNETSKAARNTYKTAHKPAKGAKDEKTRRERADRCRRKRARKTCVRETVRGARSAAAPVGRNTHTHTRQRANTKNNQRQ